MNDTTLKITIDEASMAELAAMHGALGDITARVLAATAAVNELTKAWQALRQAMPQPEPWYVRLLRQAQEARGRIGCPKSRRLK